MVAKGPFGQIPRYASFTPGPGDTGEVEAMSLWAGQGVAGVGRRQPAAEIVREIADEARATLAGLAGTL